MIDDKLIHRLGINNAKTPCLLNSPNEFDNGKQALINLTDAKQIASNYDFIMAFYKDKASLEKDILVLKEHLIKKGQLWICWPKKSSGVVSNLSDNVVREVGLASGLVDVKVIAVNPIWSGLKFVYRLTDR